MLVKVMMQDFTYLPSQFKLISAFQVLEFATCKHRVCAESFLPFHLTIVDIISGIGMETGRWRSSQSSARATTAGSTRWTPLSACTRDTPWPALTPRLVVSGPDQDRVQRPLQGC